MLSKTRGIVLRSIPFRERSLIVTVFTEHFGVQAYLINGVRGGTNRGRLALFQPLTLLELVVYHRDTPGVKRLKEYRCPMPYMNLSSEVRKSAIAVFVIELLNKTLREEHHPADLYNFLHDSMIALDSLNEGVESFHLVMMIGLSRMLGFGANDTREIIAQSGMTLTTREEGRFEQFLRCTYQTTPPSSLEERRILLEILLRFYRRHIDHFGEFRSVPVLREVLS